MRSKALQAAAIKHKGLSTGVGSKHDPINGIMTGPDIGIRRAGGLTVLFICLVVFFFTSGFFGTSSLSSLTDKFSYDIETEIPATERDVLIDSLSIRDATTKTVSNFSVMLRNELESSLSRRGFRIVPDIADAKYVVGASYQKDKDKLRVFVKCAKADLSGVKSFDYGIDLENLDPASFKEDLRSKTLQLVFNLMEGQQGRKIYISPVKEGSYKYVSEFSNSLTSSVKSEIVKLFKTVTVIDEKPRAEALANIRSIAAKAKDVKDLKTADAFYTGADSILEGEYFLSGDKVTVNMYLKDLHGKNLSSSNVDIERPMISAKLTDATAKTLSELADIKQESNGDTAVKLSTSKGGDYPVYREGEKVVFHIQVASPLFVYIYNLNPKGEATLLYPYDKAARQTALSPGVLYTIPSERDSFELPVEPPFGMEAVKAFASAIELPFPRLESTAPAMGFDKNMSRGARDVTVKRKEVQEKLSTAVKINPADLIDYYRGVAARNGTKLSESTIMLETRPK
jgi:hypothetical protein